MLTKASVAWNGLLDAVAGLIRTEWKPRKLKSEIEYRDHLLAFLRENVPRDARVEREYRHGGTTADLYLKWPGLLTTDEVFVELKRNLAQKAACDRLVGQLELLRPGSRKVLLVIVDGWDDGLVGRIQEKYQNELDEMTGSMRLVLITPEKK